MENDKLFAEPTWMIVELMGHQVIAGQVSEVTVAGAPMLRVDVPAVARGNGREGQGAFTKFFNASAVYAITPVDEASGLHAVEHLCKHPIARYTIPERVLPMVKEKEGADDLPW